MIRKYKSRNSILVGALLSASVLVGCVATKADFQILDGKLTYLETRVERNEDLITEFSGDARNEVLESRRQTQKKLDEARKQTAALLLRVQELETKFQQLVGELARQDAELGAAAKAVSEVNQRLTQNQTAVMQQSKTPESAQWASEDELYKEARKALMAKNHDRAAELFHLQTQRWPEGNLIANAVFWLGEIYYQQQAYLEAIERYLTVAEQHGDSQKAPAAYLKLAMSLEKIGESAQGLRTYQDLLKLYPDSDQATAAKNAVQRLQK